jgi:putative ABC transport system substrate-binding protein
VQRRAFIALLCGAVVLQPLAGRAQQQSKPFLIGIISPAGANSTRMFDVFRQKLRELGYNEGQNVVIEYRLTGGDFSRVPNMVADLVRLPVNVLVTDGGIGFAQIAYQTTQTIPIVMAVGPSDRGRSRRKLRSSR